MYVIKLLVKDRAPLNNHLVLQAFLHQLFNLLLLIKLGKKTRMKQTTHMVLVLCCRLGE